LILEASNKHKKVTLTLRQGAAWTSAATFANDQVYTLTKETNVGGYVTASVFGGETFKIYESTYTAQYHIHMNVRFADVIAVKKYNGFNFRIRQAVDVTSTTLLRVITLCAFCDP
jgi:hypothetical protein